MIITCVCTPIFINTFVVFIRLYWFEKRFQSVVLEARSMRATRTRTLSKRKSQMKEEKNMGDEGVLKALRTKISRERVGIELEKMLKGTSGLFCSALRARLTISKTSMLAMPSP